MVFLNNTPVLDLIEVCSVYLIAGRQQGKMKKKKKNMVSCMCEIKCTHGLQDYSFFFLLVLRRLEFFLWSRPIRALQEEDEGECFARAKLLVNV